ncbi:MAG: outer membrane protein assembly factor BamC [Methyloglobulus sp.]|nr:outer membrane protein assembly factor BamC [Methyloglobulus sp.]
MPKTLSILLLTLSLSACGTTDSGRYKDNANLERPPELPINKQTAEQVAANEVEAPIIRRHGKGLKSDIYRAEGASSEFKIKRSFDEAWSILNRAIQHNDLKVTDQDRSKGFYYVAYNTGFFGKASSYFGDERNQPTYLLKVEAQGEETSVTASLASKDEQTDSENPKNAGDETSQDQSPKLIELLYDTLRDDLKDE